MSPAGAAPPVRYTEVAAAVIQRPDGCFLLAQRPEGKPYSGYWEFPGGKIEAGETPLTALTRELEEELGIVTTHAYPWITRVYAYTHATVRLYFYRVVAWRGELRSLENQAFEWQRSGHETVGPMLPANAPILAALGLPTTYAITNAAELGAETFLRRLEAALRNGLRLIQFREKTLPENRVRALFEQTLGLAHEYGARVLVNSAHAFAGKNIANGVHLTASDLARGDTLCDSGLRAASCHDAAELRLAVELGCDFALMGPVLPTRSHPGAMTLGWEGFQQAIQGSPIPVYGVGGMSGSQLEAAWTAGAHGVAPMRKAWEVE